LLGQVLERAGAPTLVLGVVAGGTEIRFNV